jgi:hypothetical protein
MYGIVLTSINTSGLKSFASLAEGIPESISCRIRAFGINQPG